MGWTDPNLFNPGVGEAYTSAEYKTYVRDNLVYLKARPDIIRGEVSGAGAVVAGTGFTVSHGGTGRYTVTFSTAFASTPIVVAIANGTSGIEIVTLGGKSTSAFSVNIDATNTGGGQTPVDQGWSFIAMPA